MSVWLDWTDELQGINDEWASMQQENKASFMKSLGAFSASSQHSFFHSNPLFVLCSQRNCSSLLSLSPIQLSLLSQHYFAV